MSCLASRRAFESRVFDVPALARESMSAHFEVEDRPGVDVHFLRRASVKVLSGRRARRWSACSDDSQGS